MYRLNSFLITVLLSIIASVASAKDTSYECFIYDLPFGGPFAESTLVFDSSNKKYSQTIDLLDKYMVQFTFTVLKGPSGVQMKVATVNNEGSTLSSYLISGSGFPPRMSAMSWSPNGWKLDIICNRK